MKLAERIGMNKKVARRTADRRRPPLHLRRRNIVRLGPSEAGLIISCEIPALPDGPATSRRDGGCRDLGQLADGSSSALRWKS
jgi:hypothetical protein